MKLEPLLKKAFADVGADVAMAEYEKHTGSTLKARRMDVVYGFLVIEYKAPGKLGRKQTIKEAQQQLIDALSSEAQQHSDEKGFLEKAVGVALDGEHICKKALEFGLPIFTVEHEENRDLIDLGVRTLNRKTVGPFMELLGAKRQAEPPFAAQKPLKYDWVPSQSKANKKVANQKQMGFWVKEDS